MPHPHRRIHCNGCAERSFASKERCQPTPALSFVKQTAFWGAIKKHCGTPFSKKQPQI